MTHLELPLVPLVALPPHQGAARPPDLRVVPTIEALDVWAACVAAATEACLVLDGAGNVIAASEPAADLLADARPERLVGGPLERSVDLVDFTADVRPLTAAELRRIPPIAALRTQSLCRGLLRVRRPDGVLRTVDAVAAPLHGAQAPAVVGAISFLAAV